MAENESVFGILDKGLKEQKQVTAVIIGAGNRGRKYASYASDFPEKLKIAAVAEPRNTQRLSIGKKFSLPNEKLFVSWLEVVEQSKMADCVIIATQDCMHAGPAVQFAMKGYHILLEKPMAVSVEDCSAIHKACLDNNVMLAVCHVLRYFPPVIAIKQLIDGGYVGDVTHIQHTENIGYWHFAHSFVRVLAGPTIHCTELNTFTMHPFAKRTRVCLSEVSMDKFLVSYKWSDKTPDGASDRCTSCQVERTCPYSAIKVYMDPLKGIDNITEVNWPLNVVCDIEDAPPGQYKAALHKALQEGPYGKCVYQCDNNVCDNQVTNFQFKGGATATLVMTAFSGKISVRETKVYGTRGQLTWDGQSCGPIIYHNFVDGSQKNITPNTYIQSITSGLSGHGGADFDLMDSFVKAVAFNDASYIRSGPEESLKSHLLVFAAENSRLLQNIVNVECIK